MGSSSSPPPSVSRRVAENEATTTDCRKIKALSDGLKKRPARGRKLTGREPIPLVARCLSDALAQWGDRPRGARGQGRVIEAASTGRYCRRIDCTIASNVKDRSNYLTLRFALDAVSSMGDTTALLGARILIALHALRAEQCCACTRDPRRVKPKRKTDAETRWGKPTHRERGPHGTSDRPRTGARLDSRITLSLALLRPPRGVPASLTPGTTESPVPSGVHRLR